MAGHFFETLNDQWKIEDEDLTPHAEVTTNGDETEIFDAGIEILQSRFGLDIKHADINKTEFECDATNETCLKSAGYNAYQWFH